MTKDDRIPRDAHLPARLTISLTQGDLFRIDRSREGLSRSAVVMLGVHNLLHERETRTGRRSTPQELLKGAALAGKASQMSEENFLALASEAFRKAR